MPSVGIGGFVSRRKVGESFSSVLVGDGGIVAGVDRPEGLCYFFAGIGAAAGLPWPGRYMDAWALGGAVSMCARAAWAAACSAPRLLRS
jgi:hypothetical protein